MLEALLENKQSPAEIAEVGHWSLAPKIPQILEALEGHRMSDHHRFMIRQSLRHMRSIEEMIEELDKEIAVRLIKLKVNEKKSAVARPQERKFLGFSFTNGPEIRRRIAPKAVDRFKERIREITRQAKGVSLETTIATLAPYMRGWRGYFGFCETPQVLIDLTRWVRRRLRAALWRQWRTQRRRRAMLIQLGVRGRLADNTAGSGLGPWHLAHSKALNVALSNTYFRNRGLPSLFEQC